MRRVVARVALACALVFVLGACGTFGSYVGLGTDEPGWKEDGRQPGETLLASDAETSIRVSAGIVPCEFPITVHVTNLAGGELRVVVAHPAESAETDAAPGVVLVEGTGEGARPIELGTEVVLRAASPGALPAAAVFSLRADRPWTMEEFVREGDTISWDLVLRRDGVETVHPLRFSVVHVGSRFRWWTPLLVAGVVAGAIAAPEIALHVFLNAL